jgi:hypothetical protein
VSARFRVGVDTEHRLFFVRDTVTGRCRGTYGTASEAFAVAQRGNRALGIVR